MSVGRRKDRFQHEDGYQMANGLMKLTNPGRPGTQSNRLSDAQAWAVFAQDELDWSNWTVIPGVRFETIELVRTDYSRNDTDRVAPNRVRTDEVTVAIVGIGVGYDASPELRVFGGIHKGFSPPGPGSAEFTDAGKSINYEIGVRFDQPAFGVDLTGFFNDYSNLLGTDTLTSGGTGSGDLFNGGEANVVGIEAAARFRCHRRDRSSG